MTKSDDNYLGD
jgi:hypothetical protein